MILADVRFPNRSVFQCSITCIVLVSCLQMETSAQSRSDSGVFPFDLAHSVQQLTLVRELREISGLTVLDSTHVLTLQDEKGLIYTVSTRTGKIVDRSRFAGKGDYEGIELVNGTLYVLRSDGLLFVRPSWPSPGATTRQIQTGVGRDCNAEGLGVSTDLGLLFIACKSGPKKSVRAVYSFRIRDERSTSVPLFTISRDSMNTHTLLNHFSMSSFSPSGIAVHPITKEIYVLSSRDRTITRLNGAYDILDVHELTDKKLIQAEGITFLPNGDLLISSEGKKRGILIRYQYESSDSDLN